MGRYLETLIAWFFDDYRFQRQTRIFKRLLYVLAMIKCLFWLVRYDLYFGPQAIIYHKPLVLTWPDGPAFLLYASTSPYAAYFFIAAVLALCLLCLAWPRAYFLPELLIWFLMLNLHNSVYATLTGGDYLLNQFLLFNVLLSASYTVTGSFGNALKRLAHNLVIVALFIQVCLVYLLSALAKLADPQWLSGHAVYLIAQVRHYSLPWQLFNRPGFFPALLNYLVLAYQLLFPLLIWFRAVKKPFIFIGMLMHLYIGLVMGLPMFAAVMMIPYVYFWTSGRELRV